MSLLEKILAFFKEYASTIIGIIFVLALVTAFFVPLFVAIARVMWDAAINNPTALM